MKPNGYIRGQDKLCFDNFVFEKSESSLCRHIRLLRVQASILYASQGWRFKRGDGAQDTEDERMYTEGVRQGRTEMWRTGTQILRVTEKQRSEVE